MWLLFFFTFVLLYYQVVDIFGKNTLFSCNASSQYLEMAESTSLIILAISGLSAFLPLSEELLFWNDSSNLRYSK